MGCGSSNSTDDKNAFYNNLQRQKKTEIKQSRRAFKKKSYKDIIILDNVQKYIPENTNRDEIKDMVYHALEIKDTKNKSKGNLTQEQVEALIDLLARTVNSQDNNNPEDKRLDGVKATIGFYDADKENVKQLFFRDQKPSEEEVEEKLNDLISINDDIKVFAIEF